MKNFVQSFLRTIDFLPHFNASCFFPSYKFSVLAALLSHEFKRIFLCHFKVRLIFLVAMQNFMFISLDHHCVSRKRINIVKNIEAKADCKNKLTS